MIVKLTRLVNFPNKLLLICSSLSVFSLSFSLCLPLSLSLCLSVPLPLCLSLPSFLPASLSPLQHNSFPLLVTHFKFEKVSISPRCSSFLPSYLSPLSLSYNTLHFNYSSDSFATLTPFTALVSFWPTKSLVMICLFRSSLCACSLSAFWCSIACPTVRCMQHLQLAGNAH